MANRNGYVPANQLVVVDGVHLWHGTANAYREMKAAAGKHITGIYLPIGGYRSITTQADMRVHPAKYNLEKGVAIAAPGSSTHGLGLAVDIIGDRAWLAANAHRWGFSWPLGNSDPHHYLHDGHTAIGTSTASTGAVTALTPKRSNKMPKGINRSTTTTVKGKKVTTKQYYRVDIPDVVLPVSKDEMKAYNKVNGYLTTVPVTANGLAEFEAMAARVTAARK